MQQERGQYWGDAGRGDTPVAPPRLKQSSGSFLNEVLQKICEHLIQTAGLILITTRRSLLIESGLADLKNLILSHLCTRLLIWHPSIIDEV